MILRRIIAHFRKQEWTAIAIDFLIVVFGVFIGLQVQEYSSARADRQSETEILLAIADDIRLERLELADGMAAALLSIRATNAALLAAGDPPITAVVMPSTGRQSVGRPLDPNALDLSALVDALPDPSASVWKPIVVRAFPTASSAAFDTLVSAGELGIIENEVLVRRLQLYRQLWRGLEDSQALSFRQFRNQALYIGQTEGLSPFTDIPAGRLAALMRDNRQLKGAVGTTCEFAILHYSQMQRVDAEAASLLQLIEAELARRSDAGP
jgi:hypothetical protein